MEKHVGVKKWYQLNVPRLLSSLPQNIKKVNNKWTRPPHSSSEVLKRWTDYETNLKITILEWITRVCAHQLFIGHYVEGLGHLIRDNKAISGSRRVYVEEWVLTSRPSHVSLLSHPSQLHGGKHVRYTHTACDLAQLYWRTLTNGNPVSNKE